LVNKIDEEEYMRTVEINGKIIGGSAPCYVIAEIGSNHNGDLDTAKKMIRIAKDHGVDAVKFQIFKEKTLYPIDAGKVDYLNITQTINELVRENEVPDEYHMALLHYCKEIGVDYLCTPTDEKLADYLDDIGVSGFKIASYALTHIPLLKHIAKKGKPIILSTGCTNLEEIAEAVRIIREAGNDQLILMQCVSQYPADINHTNINVINTLKTAFQVPVGMSDHSFDPYVVPYASVAIGADVIEKHYTLDRSQDGPDHSFAVEPSELKQMTAGIRAVEAAMGTAEKYVTEVEAEMRLFAHRSVFTTENLEVGTVISVDNTAILRPGKKAPGIAPKHYEQILGARVLHPVLAGTSVKWTDILNIT
jgi:N,N'-diacetyllegionaminate synthase